MLIVTLSLIEFISHTSDLYPDLTPTFSDDLIHILVTHHEVMDMDLRDKIVGSVALLRKKEVIDANKLLETFLPLLISTPSKSLRQLLFTRILSELRNGNNKTINHKLNKTTQTALYNLLESDKASPKGIWAVKITRELWYVLEYSHYFHALIATQETADMDRRARSGGYAIGSPQ
jgi:protein SDA1